MDDVSRVRHILHGLMDNRQGESLIAIFYLVSAVGLFVLLLVLSLPQHVREARIFIHPPSSLGNIVTVQPNPKALRNKLEASHAIRGNSCDLRVRFDDICPSSVVVSGSSSPSPVRGMSSSGQSVLRLISNSRFSSRLSRPSGLHVTFCYAPLHSLPIFAFIGVRYPCSPHRSLQSPHMPLCFCYSSAG